MNGTLFEILNSSKSTDYAAASLVFIRTGEACDLPPVPYPQHGYDLNPVWDLLAGMTNWGEEETRMAEIAVDSAVRFHRFSHAGGPLRRLLGDLTRNWDEPRVSTEQVLVNLLERHKATAETIEAIVESDYSGRRTWGLGSNEKASGPTFASPLERMLFGSDDATLAALLWSAHSSSRFVELIARFRPEVIRIWWSRKSSGRIHTAHWIWREIIRFTDRFDAEFLDCLNNHVPAPDRFFLLLKLRELRGGYEDLLTEIARIPESLQTAHSLTWLLDRHPEEVIDRMTAAVKAKALKGTRLATSIEPYKRFFDLVIRDWNRNGRVLFESLREGDCHDLELRAISEVLAQLPSSAEKAGDIIACLAGRSADDTSSRWDVLELWLGNNPCDPQEIRVYEEAFWKMLGNPSIKLRSHGAKLILALSIPTSIEKAISLLTSGKADQKLGAITLLLGIQDPKVMEALRSALVSETSEKVRAALHSALRTAGMETDAQTPGAVSSMTYEDLVSSLPKGMKLPKCDWLDLSKLPELRSANGTEITQPTLIALIAKQSKHKEITAAPDILPLLSHIDRESSGSFALALVEGFLNSGQAATDRWALALGGLLGDNRMISLLLSRIPDWCENSRHKLAEYAAQAISLLPGNEPLMVLDTLSNRYRSKFKNVGKACADVFNAAAASRGITADELGDLVVPDFGFNSEGIRRFEWEGGGASAELGADFKLGWFDPATDKAWKALPASAPEPIKTEVRTIIKLLREAVKGQTTRLEMTLVRQRRWPVARWRELFEDHPLLRSFASGLVWGVYGSEGNLLRTFRRYPNGLLADATGALEEFPGDEVAIGMVHPLEMEAQDLNGWRLHLARLKVKQPFPQVERPVELMDPLHGNRRELALTSGCRISAGTFRSRSERRGWARGSVVDAGGISSYYKLYPGAGVEVILPTDNFWVGCDPTEIIELGAAYFVRSNTVERGSYIYNEPSPDDPRVLRFDQVSAVVFSETLGDLKAIIATRE